MDEGAPGSIRMSLLGCMLEPEASLLALKPVPDPELGASVVEEIMVVVAAGVGCLEELVAGEMLVREVFELSVVVTAPGWCEVGRWWGEGALAWDDNLSCIKCGEHGGGVLGRVESSVWATPPLSGGLGVRVLGP